MDKLKLNNSILANENVFLNFFKLKYDFLPNSLDQFDSEVLNTIKLIDDSYVNNTISFEEVFNLLSIIFSGIELSNNDIIDRVPLNSDYFYNMLINNKFDNNTLDDLLKNKKISYQLYLDGLNYLSRESS